MKSRKRISDSVINYRNDQKELPRVSGSSDEYSNETKFWDVKGLLHRIYGPSYEWYDGDKLWHWRVNDKPFNIFKKVS